MNRDRILALVRLILMILASINSMLLAKGINPIPFDENVVMETATHVIDALIILYGWWKDNDVSAKAQQRKACAKAVEEGVLTVIPAEEIYEEDIEDVEELDVEYEGLGEK